MNYGLKVTGIYLLVFLFLLEFPLATLCKLLELLVEANLKTEGFSLLVVLLTFVFDLVANWLLAHFNVETR